MTNLFLDEKAASANNPFIGLDDGIEPTRQGPAVLSAQERQPDAWAEAKRKGARLGVAPEVVERNPAEVRRLELRRSLDEVRQSNPALADWLLRDDNLTLAQDDTESLGFIDRMFNSGEYAARRVPALAGSLAGTVADISERAGDKLTLTMPQWLRGNKNLTDDAIRNERQVEPLFQLADWLKSFEGEQQGMTTFDDVKGNPLNAPSFVAEQVVASAPDMAAAVAALPAYVLSRTGEIANTRAGNDGRTEVTSSDYAAALPAALLEATFERFATGRLFKAGTGTALRRVGKEVAVQAGTEGAEEGFSNLGETVGTKTGFNLQQFADAVGAGALVGAGLGGSVEGTKAAFEQYQGAVEARQRGQQENEQVDALSKIVQKSKLLERDPEKLADAVASLKSSGMSNVYVPAEAVMTLFQSEPDSAQAFEAAGIDRQSVQESLVLGSDVAIPMEAYLVRIAPQYHGALGKAARLSPDAVTDGDIDANDEQDAAVERFLASVNDAPADGQADMRVYNDVLGQLLGSYSQADAEQMASVVNAFFRDGIGKRSGIDPFEAYQRYGLRVIDEVRQRVMPDRAAPEFDAMIERLRTGDIPTEDQALGPTIGEFLSERGIRSAPNEPMSGEIRRLTENDRFTRRGRKRLVREDDPNAMTLDYAREAAVEAGYLPEGSDINDLLDALENDARPMTPADANASELRSALLELSDEMGSRGLDPTSMSNAEIRRAMFGVAELDQAATDQTQTPEFKRWFGDSKVVDADGKPLVVYHGTGAEFDAFDKNMTMDSAFWFSSRREEVERGDAGASSRNRIIDAYLSIKNPAGWDQYERLTYDQLIQAGYDGVALDMGDGRTHYIAFEPEQIKSATGNRGTFDQNDPSILNQQRRGYLQFGQNRQFTIGLTKARDLSTFLHEFGHFGLEVMADMAASDPVFAGEFEVLSRWWQDNADAVIATMPAADRANLTPDLIRAVAADFKGDHGEHTNVARTALHEYFARGFERYLAEGKPPSPELAAPFARFKAWLRSIYKSLAGLNVELNDEVRGFMARMLAGDDAVVEAERAAVAEPLFKEVARAGMTEAQFTAYLELQAKAHDEAEARVTAEAYRETMREREKWWREESKRVEAEVRAEFEALPVYRAWEALARNRAPDGTPLETPPVKLAKQWLLDRYGQDWLNKNLLRRQVYSADGGVHGDVIAPVFGFQTGSEMIEALTNAAPLNKAVRAEVEARMRETHGDMRNDGSLPEKAMRAVHGNRRIKLIEAEIAALARLANEPAMTAAQARKWAARQVAGKRVRDIVPYAYLRAERKAAREALRAAAAGKHTDALAAARRRLANAVMYDEASKARKRVEARTARIKAMAKPKAQERLGKAGADFRDAVNGLLAAASIRPLSEAEQARQKPLRAFVERLQEQGEDTAVTEAVLSLVESGRPVTVRDMTVGQFDDVYAAIKNLRHIAGNTGKLLAAADRATLEQAVAAMSARAGETHPDRLPEMLSRRDASTAQLAAERLRRLATELDRPENIIEALDGGESGPWHDYYLGALNAAENTAIGLRKRVGTALRALRKSMPYGFMRSLEEPVEVAGVGQVSRGTLVGMVLNTGNAANLQRLRDGGIHVNGQPVMLDDTQVQAMRDLLTSDEARYVQGLWDAVNSLWPDISALQTEMSGIPPEKVEAQAFEAAGVPMRGGYWPLAYDHSKSDVGERQADDDALRIMMGQSYTRATTPKGHTKARVENLRAPLLLDFGAVMSRHLDNVMTDLAYRKAVKDTVRLLRHPTIKDAIVNRLGKGAYDNLKGQVAYAVSAGDMAGQAASAARQIVSKVVSNSAISALAIRPDIVLGNYTSAMAQALDRVGIRSLTRGWWELRRHRSDLTQRISSLSPFMAERLGMIDEDYRVELAKAQGRTGFGEAYRRVMMTLHRWADHDVVRAAWWGRYQEALAAGETSSESVRLADKLVRQTQTASARKDESPIERDPAFRESRMFMGPMFVILGRLRAAARGEGATRTVGARAASIMLQMFLSPSLFMLAAGRWPTDTDDDDEIGMGEWSTWLAANTLLFPLQAIPVLREAAGAVEAGATDRPINPRAAPTAQAVSGLVKASKSISDNVANYRDTGEFDWFDMTRDLATMAGPFTGAPAGQIRVTTKTIEAIQDDPDRDRTELARMALYGPPRQ